MSEQSIDSGNGKPRAARILTSAIAKLEFAHHELDHDLRHWGSKVDYFLHIKTLEHLISSLKSDLAKESMDT